MMIYGHAAGPGAQPKASRRQDPRHFARVRHLRLGGWRPAILICSRSPRPTGRKARRRSKFVKDNLGGSLNGKKIAYVYYDNPAGHEPLPILEDLQKMEGFELRSFAVPPPGVEMGAQVLDITQRYRPDFVIDHLFGPDGNRVEAACHLAP